MSLEVVPCCPARMRSRHSDMSCQTPCISQEWSLVRNSCIWEILYEPIEVIVFTDFFYCIWFVLTRNVLWLVRFGRRRETKVMDGSVESMTSMTRSTRRRRLELSSKPLVERRQQATLLSTTSLLQTA